MKAKARAYANIALIKYWGKENETLIIPNNSSLSLTLDQFYTETKVEFRDDIKEDEFYLDGLKDDKTLDKVSRFTDLFRTLKNINTRVMIKSENFVPTAAGLASSASAFAALGAALNEALELGLSKEDLSKLVRQGSGSATRSVYGGLVEWQKGNSHETSFAKKVDDGSWDLAMVAVLVNKNEKAISSREGMKQTILTSPFYKEWPQEAEKDLVLIKKAINQKDFDTMGKIAENNALKMHATMMSANPSIMYMEPDSLKAMNIVKDLREKNISAYFTMDAGPNVKVLCKYSEAQLIKDALLKEFKEEDIIISGVGSDVEII